MSNTVSSQIFKFFQTCFQTGSLPTGGSFNADAFNFGDVSVFLNSLLQSGNATGDTIANGQGTDILNQAQDIYNQVQATQSALQEESNGQEGNGLDIDDILNGKDSISQDNFFDYLSKNGMSIGKDQQTEMFNQLDINGDGKLDKSELKNLANEVDANNDQTSDKAIDKEDIDKINEDVKKAQAIEAERAANPEMPVGGSPSSSGGGLNGQQSIPTNGGNSAIQGATIEEKIDDANSKIEANETKIKEARDKADTALAEEESKFQEDIDAKLEEAGIATEEFDNAEKEVNDKTKDVSTAERNVSSCETTLSNDENALACAQAELDAMPLNDQSGIEGQDAKIAARRAELQQEIADKKAAVEADRTALDAAKEALEQAKTALQTAETKRNDILDKLNQIDGIEDIRTEHDTKIKEINDTKEKTVTAEEANLAENREVLSALEQTKATMDGAMAGATDKGIALAKVAEMLANKRNTKGWCLAGVNDALQQVYGFRISEDSAYKTLDNFQAMCQGPDAKFQEVSVSADQLASLPAGAIVVWDQGSSSRGMQFGHISVSLGDGREASDHVQQQWTNLGTYHVFLPTGK